MTLLLLLTSSGGPKPAAAELNAFSGLTATATDQAPVSPTATVAAVADATATLRIATDRAAEVIYVTSDLVATLRTSTTRPSATITAVATPQAIFEARPALKPAGAVAASASLSAFLDQRTQRISGLIPGLAEVFIRIPPRSVGGVASAAAGRSGSGSLTGGGRGAAGTATSAPGR